METQKRTLKCELRADSVGRSIVGKIPYNSPADLGGFQEILVPGCFSRSIRSGRKILSLWAHDTGKPLANSQSGTLKLDDRSDGLYVTITPDPESTWGRDALSAARRQDIGGLSFGFALNPGGESRNGNSRFILDAELIEISPCVFPAYQESNVSIRNKNMNQASRVGNEYRDEKGRKLYTSEEIRQMNDDYERQQRYGGPPDFSQISVEDAPIYRGPYALGQQAIDVINMNRPGPGTDEARSRFEAMVNREKAIAEKRAAGTGGMVMATGQDGGLLLQGETSMDLLTSGFNNSEVLSRSSGRDLGTSQFVELIGIDETSRADGSRGGGVRVYTDKELEQIIQSKPKFDKVRLEPKRLTGMMYVSNEMLDNAPMLTGEIEQLFTEEFSFKGQDLAVNGSGAGEALGVMNAPCLITVAKEVGQGAATVIFENLLKMKTRIRIRNRKSLTWLAHQDVESELYKISLPIGTGGAVIPAYIPSNNPANGIAGTLMGYPIILIEQCETLGTVGDIILGDWSAYLAASKGGVQSASSIHLKFDYNQTAFRFVTYFDGQPRLKAPITPFKGNNTVSPFVALATR